MINRERERERERVAQGEKESIEAKFQWAMLYLAWRSLIEGDGPLDWPSSRP